MTGDRESNMSLLGKKTEMLLELGIAATVGCDSCIDHHVLASREAGATDREIRQTIDLARQIGGKSALQCCEEAMHHLGGLDAAS